ncbi:GNAT family N-acetyltransferase [Sinosporangium siamense]|uniref:N-acetyltransferase GCN5 n=1 Tax=Sinosporangium siamense TaxID=1367973 RepID=A0A919RHV5_9ACTN|nr:GNAT family N-acetyltransferase [Sinosporangium siamense]GII94123.1 N-acetyltransferase GCN5 [Sinosporangium siamense]
MEEMTIGVATAQEMRSLREWADREGWNPGETDGQAFFAADPHGFFMGRLNGEAIASISAVRYEADFGFIGFYIVSPELRGQGYGIQVWKAGMAHLEGRNIALDGVVDQQANYRRSGFRRVWNHVRYEGVPYAAEQVGDVTVVDARTIPFDHLAAYDRRFFPAARDAFLASWVSLPDRTALAVLRDGELQGFGVVRPAAGAWRIGPLYAASENVALSLVSALAAGKPGLPIAIDVPDINKPSVAMAERLGLRPSFEAARMYTGPVPDVDLKGIYATTSLELG